MSASGQRISSVKLTASQDSSPVPHSIPLYFRGKCPYLAFLALTRVEDEIREVALSSLVPSNILSLNSPLPVAKQGSGLDGYLPKDIRRECDVDPALPRTPKKNIFYLPSGAGAVIKGMKPSRAVIRAGD